MEPVIKTGEWTRANRIGSDDQPDIRLAAEINKIKSGRIDTIVVLDDDPTGTQTVYDVPVLTDWETDTLNTEIIGGTSLFFILTNSRSMGELEAEELASTIGKRLHQISLESGKKIFVISRSDSTLRGHYPAECVALETGLGWADTVHFIIPAFFEGGRYTIRDIHYVQQGKELVPAAQTSYAQDKVFGFKNSNLTRWVEEKTKGKVRWHDVHSISLEDIREMPVDRLIEKLQGYDPGSVCIVNATHYEDLQKFTLALIQSGTRPMCRTAASFVKAVSGLPPRDLLTRRELSVPSSLGGLIIVGSYVPKTTEQVEYLITNAIADSMELKVMELLNVDDQKEFVRQYVEEIERFLKSGRDLVLYTSRELIATDSPEENLLIGNRVSQSLTQIVASLQVRPKYIVSKGGITASDVATKGLSVRKALIMGQILAGIPVWRLGPESKYPGLPYVVFPGNVGNGQALFDVAELLK